MASTKIIQRRKKNIKTNDKKNSIIKIICSNRYSKSTKDKSLGKFAFFRSNKSNHNVFIKFEILKMYNSQHKHATKIYIIMIIKCDTLN